MILHTYWTILLIFFTGFMVYYNITTSMVLNAEDKISIVKESTTIVKKIVAYSLNKQMELEGQEYFCDKYFQNFNISNIKYASGFWNRVDDTELYVTSVTLDKRLEPYHYLRIVGVIKGRWNATTYCQILTNDGHVRIIKSTVTPIWYEKWDMNDNNTYYNPTLVSCRLPTFEINQTPMAVSLSLNPCGFKNKVHKITRPVETKQVNFTLCVKPLNFNKDISNHLVQWIEICKILGAEYFHIFIDNVTKNTRRVLEWYKHQFPNTLHIEDFQSVETKCQNCTARSYFQKTWQRRRFEVVAYNKCFNRNLHSKFIIPLDIDEIIVPKTVRTWHELAYHFDNYSSLIVQNVYFFTGKKTRYNRPFFLSENRRIKVPSKKGENGKSFIATKNALTVFNHYALHLLKPGVLKEYFLPFRDVQLNHYKESCNHVIFPECTKYQSSPAVIDNVIISKYKNEFNERFENLLTRLKDYQIKIV